jgi:hypothetical protein
MRAVKRFFFFPVCVVFILSCASVSKKDRLKDQPHAYLTDSSKFVLLPPGGIEQAVDMVQFLSAEIMGQNYFFNTWVKANENAIEMVFFNELGASMGELSYRDGTVNFSSTVFPKSVVRYIKPEYIIADFQLCFYDPSLLDKSLKDSGLVLETQNGSRRILSGNEVIIEIKKTENTVRLENHLRRYVYTLEGDFHDG